MDIFVNTTKRKQVVDVTDQLQHVISEQKFEAGLCHVFALHTTACLTTADLDPGTDLDMLDAFEHMVPKLHYRHPHNPAHVGDHILSSMVGPLVSIPVRNGKLQLGDWQRVVLIELDGPRKRSLLVTLIPVKS